MCLCARAVGPFGCTPTRGSALLQPISSHLQALLTINAEPGGRSSSFRRKAATSRVRLRFIMVLASLFEPNAYIAFPYHCHSLCCHGRSRSYSLSVQVHVRKEVRRDTLQPAPFLLNTALVCRKNNSPVFDCGVNCAELAILCRQQQSSRARVSRGPAPFAWDCRTHAGRWVGYKQLVVNRR